MLYVCIRYIFRTKPTKRHLFITKSQVEEFAFNALRIHTLEEDGTGIHILRALLLRVQSGSNLRSGNLCGDVHWRDVHCQPSSALSGFGKLFSIDLVNTKSMPRLRQERKVTRHLDDQLSHHLVHTWWAKHHWARSPDDYFFPLWRKGQWDFRRPMSNVQHCQAVQACAEFCGLHQHHLFTSTSIRRGNALTTEVDVQRLRAERNKQFAWAPHSEVDLKHYCPEGVMVQPGPLFLSTASLKVKCLEVTDLVLRVNGQCLCFFFRYQTSG